MSDSIKLADCYCVCHSPLSSRASCVHCNGDNEVGRYHRRKRAVEIALGSVRLEYPDYEPPEAMKRDTEAFINGDITATQLREKTLKRIKQELL